MMKYRIITIVWAGLLCPAMRGQQPRLPQVEQYQAATGTVKETPAAGEIRYNLLGTLYDGKTRLMLNLPDFRDKGTKEVMPFGYRLKPVSEVEMERVAGNLSESRLRRLWNRSVFTGVSYLFCDSTVYGIRLHYRPGDAAAREFADRELTAFFKKADYRSDSLTVYSDQDYLAKAGRDGVEVYSLYHYPATETRFPGVTHFYWEAPCTLPVEGIGVALCFYNQRTKENNLQTAFRLKTTGNDGKRFVMKSIRFETDNQAYSYPLERDFCTTAGGIYGETDMRTFIFPEEAKEILRSGRVTVTIAGEGGRSVSYEMPMFQRISLFTAYEYFRRCVTHAMEKYKNW